MKKKNKNLCKKEFVIITTEDELRDVIDGMLKEIKIFNIEAKPIDLYAKNKQEGKIVYYIKIEYLEVK